MPSSLIHQTCLDFERQIYAIVGPGLPTTYAPNANSGSQYTNAATGDLYVMLGTTWTLLGAAGSGSTAWSSITGKPNTVAGFGITDALTTSYVPTWASISGKPSTRDGYGLTDVYTKSESDSRYLASSYVPSWSALAGKPSTRDGFGLTDVYTKAEADARFLQLSGGTMTGNIIAPDFVLA